MQGVDEEAGQPVGAGVVAADDEVERGVDVLVRQVQQSLSENKIWHLSSQNENNSEPEVEKTQTPTPASANAVSEQSRKSL